MTDNPGLSRRTLAKGAAWAVPAVAVAAAAPAMAASTGPLTFTGNACKLPGNSNDLFKGYVFELLANNTKGPNPLDTITVISYVKIASAAAAETNYKVVAEPAYSTCTCTDCGDVLADKQFCTPDGVTGQKIYILTGAAPTGNSQNAEMIIKYQRFQCSGTTCVPFDAAPITLSSGVRSTESYNGAKCLIDLPAGTI